MGDDGLYVLGENGKIGVYSCAPNGNFICHLDLQRFSVKLELSDLWGVCIDCSGHLFITQAGSSLRGVHVFKCSGEHVAYLSLGRDEVSMVWPAGIAIDEDGLFMCVIPTPPKFC